jgi:hypothetical protein
MKTIVEIAQRILDLRAEVEEFGKEYHLNQIYSYSYEHPTFPDNPKIAQKQAELHELCQILSNQAYGDIPIYPMRLGGEDTERGKYNALKWFVGNE